MLWDFYKLLAQKLYLYISDSRIDIRVYGTVRVLYTPIFLTFLSISTCHAADLCALSSFHDHLPRHNISNTHHLSPSGIVARSM